MITDERVFDIEGFVPEQVEHRNDELQALASSLQPLLRGQRGEQTFIVGPPGTGKTCAARFALRQLEREEDVAVQYVNCWQHHTRFDVLEQLASVVALTTDVHRQSTAHSTLLERIEHSERPIVAVLDEVDQTDDMRVLYNLHRLHHVYLVLIANRERDVMGRMDDRLGSRFGVAAHIQFDPYSVDELATILARRAELALPPRAVDRPVLEYIADRAAGDAREGILLLSAAAKRASQDGERAITADHVDAATGDARAELRQRTLSNLNKDQRVLYEVLDESDEPVRAGALYREYRDRVDDPKSDRTLRRYLEKMDQYNLIEAIGATSNRAYQVR